MIQNVSVYVKKLFLTDLRTVYIYLIWSHYTQILGSEDKQSLRQREMQIDASQCKYCVLPAFRFTTKAALICMDSEPVQILMQIDASPSSFDLTKQVSYNSNKSVAE